MPRLGMGICIPAARATALLAVGPEQLLNGEFDSDTVWNKGLGWVIAGGLATVTTPGVTSSLSQPIAFSAGARYQMTIVITAMPAGGIFVRAYTGATPTFSFGATITAAGTYTRIATVSGSPDVFSIDGSSAVMASVNSVSLKRVL